MPRENEIRPWKEGIKGATTDPYTYATGSQFLKTSKEHIREAQSNCS